MLLPIRTSIQPRKTPYANFFLIAVNIFVFFLTYAGESNPEQTLRPWAEDFMLIPILPRIWQFVTYAFLHANVMHIIGNMYFLWLFGNNVNDKLGNVGYTCFYFAGAVFAGIGHTLLHNNPVLGASGAVAAVTGAYLVLFPKTLITIVYWFFFIGTAEFSALWFIGFKLIAWDNIVEPGFSKSAVAYDAHLVGYAFGILCSLLLLGLNLLDRNYTDLFSMLKQASRRRQYRDAVSSGYDPYKGPVFTNSKKIKVKQSDSPRQQADNKVVDMRSEITSLINVRDFTSAADKYAELLKIDSDQVLPRNHQLEIANQLMAMGRFSESAQAYEKMIAYYSGHEHIEQIELMLGLIYRRYLNNGQLARKYLEMALPKLTDESQKKMCAEELRLI
jgi:membrane associated rhomboid family serine protease